MSVVVSGSKTLPRMGKKKKRATSPLASPNATSKASEFLPTLARVEIDDKTSRPIKEVKETKVDEIDLFKSLESLNEEIRQTLPWTTPAKEDSTVGKPPSNGKSFLDAPDTVADFSFHTSIVDDHVYEDEREQRRRKTKSVTDLTLSAKKLDEIEDELRIRGLTRKRLAGDTEDEDQDKEHEQIMRDLELQEATEKQKMQELLEAEEIRRQNSIEEENSKRRLRITKLEEDNRRKRISREKEEDDNRRRKIAKEQEDRKRQKMKAEDELRKKEIEQLKSEVKDEKEGWKNPISVDDGITSKPSINIITATPTTILDDFKDEKRTRNKTANIPIMPQEDKKPTTTSKISSLSKYNLETHSLVSIHHKHSVMTKNQIFR